MTKTLKEALVDKVALKILEYDNKDYCRACDLGSCISPPCKSIRDLASVLITYLKDNLSDIVEMDKGKIKKAIKDITGIQGEGPEGYLIDDLDDLASALASDKSILRLKNE